LTSEGVPEQVLGRAVVNRPDDVSDHPHGVAPLEIILGDSVPRLVGVLNPGQVDELGAQIQGATGQGDFQLDQLDDGPVLGRLVILVVRGVDVFLDLETEVRIQSQWPNF
jgi:hypothetical protein